MMSSPWMTSDPLLHVALGADLRRPPVRLRRDVPDIP